MQRFSMVFVRSRRDPGEVRPHAGAARAVLRATFTFELGACCAARPAVAKPPEVLTASAVAALLRNNPNLLTLNISTNPVGRVCAVLTRCNRCYELDCGSDFTFLLALLLLLLLIFFFLALAWYRQNCGRGIKSPVYSRPSYGSCSYRRRLSGMFPRSRADW